MKAVYIVIACRDGSAEYYDIDSVWTSRRKAEKRRDELNGSITEETILKTGCGLYDIVPMCVST